MMNSERTGARRHRRSSHGGGRGVYFYDPNGHLFELLTME
jgi:catechol 2,3-dioxygenase-like lactoylglutathione lyase family enzyme